MSEERITNDQKIKIIELALRDKSKLIPVSVTLQDCEKMIDWIRKYRPRKDD